LTGFTGQAFHKDGMNVMQRPVGAGDHGSLARLALFSIRRNRRPPGRLRRNPAVQKGQPDIIRLA